MIIKQYKLTQSTGKISSCCVEMPILAKILCIDRVDSGFELTAIVHEHDPNSTRHFEFYTPNVVLPRNGALICRLPFITNVEPQGAFLFEIFPVEEETPVNTEGSYTLTIITRDDTKHEFAVKTAADIDAIIRGENVPEHTVFTDTLKQLLLDDKPLFKTASGGYLAPQHGLLLRAKEVL